MTPIAIAEKISKGLESKGLKSNFTTSDTDFGTSCYFYFEDYKVRISDHSVQNSSRLFNEEHLDAKKVTEESIKSFVEGIEYLYYPNNFELKMVEKLEPNSGKKYHIISGQLYERVRKN